MESESRQKHGVLDDRVLLPHLRHLVPTRGLDGRSDELGADVRLGEGLFVHRVVARKWARKAEWGTGWVKVERRRSSKGREGKHRPCQSPS